MSRIYKRGSVWWVYWPARVAGEAIRESTGCRTKEAARRWAARRERELSDPATALRESATLREALDSMVVEKERAGKPPSTITFYIERAKALLVTMGDVRLADLDAEVVDDFIKARRAKGISDHTIHKDLTALRAALKTAHRLGALARSPLTILPTSFSPRYQPRQRWLTRDEADALMMQLPPRRRAVVGFILATGARLGEAMAAEARDVDLDRGVVFIRGTKTKRAKGHVPILPHVRPELEHALAYLPFERWTNVRRDLAKACEKAEIERCTPNDLRRTSAHWLRQLVADLSTKPVANFLRQTSTRMADETYAWMSGAELGRALEARMVQGPACTDVAQSGGEEGGES